MTAASARPEKILKELAKLWVDLAHDDHEKNASGVLRACAMTLIAAVEEEQQAQSVGETIAELMHEHPSRAIVLHVKASGEALDARVFAQCWMPFGRRQQICCEEIEITAPESYLADVPKLLLGLTVPDLPVVLWIRGPSLALNSEFQKVFPLSTKIVVDTDAVADRTAAFELLKDLNRRGENAVDLAWTRMTPWREMVARIFEDESNRRRLGEIHSVNVAHSGEPAGLKYLSNWFRHAIPSAAIRFQPIERSGPPAISKIEIIGNEFHATVSIEDGSCAVVEVNGLASRTFLTPRTEHTLLREELAIIGTDPIFVGTLE